MNNQAANHVMDVRERSDLPVQNPSHQAMEDIVAEYAAAKSRQNTEAALKVCTHDFTLYTEAIYSTATGQADVRRQLNYLFKVFPDYHVDLEGSAGNNYGYTCWGTARMTMKRRIGPWTATQRTTQLPFFCLFTFRDEQIASEKFFFSRDAMAQQLGLPANTFRRLSKFVAHLPMRVQVAI